MGLSSECEPKQRKNMMLMVGSAMMSAISEAWTIMNKHMGMNYDDIGDVFSKWSSEGELVSIFCQWLELLLTMEEKHFSGQDRCGYRQKKGRGTQSCSRRRAR